MASIAAEKISRTGAPILPGSVTSTDGTRIGYRQTGSGPGLVLVQGTMGTASHFRELASSLSDTFTVYTPDRRGRGMSDAGEYGLRQEIEDLDALLSHTGARYIFGLSAGAIITLEAARTLSKLEKLAIFEPPFFLGDLPVALLDRFDREYAQGDIPAAMVTAMLAGRFGPSWLRFIPGGLLKRFVAMGMAQEEKKPNGDYPTMRSLSATLPSDFKIIRQGDGPISRFSTLEKEILLLGGGKSPAYFTAALDALEKTLPQVTRVTFENLGHDAAWNSDKRGNPQQVAQALCQFFSA